MIEATNGINYAHLRGLLHRDLKLTNILVSSRGQAKLVDFGLAGGIEGVAEDTESVENDRTIDYAGLERATGVRKDDPRSDIYFLGCIYYHLLTGKPPLQETRERIQRLAKGRFVDVVPIHRVDPEMPRVVSMVVNKAMELDADRRYQTPGQMLIDLNIAAKRLADGTDIPSAAEDGRPTGAAIAAAVPRPSACVLLP
jgi:serine/threonine protein kinase